MVELDFFYIPKNVRDLGTLRSNLMYAFCSNWAAKITRIQTAPRIGLVEGNPFLGQTWILRVSEYTPVNLVGKWTY